MSLVSEFKEFINKGNVMDMAVGVTIGAAFTAIVTALTTKIVTPLISAATGGTVGPDGVAVGGMVGPGTAIDFGAFIGAVINFLLVAIVVFLVVKGFNKMRTTAEKAIKKDEEEEAAAEPILCPFCLEEVKEGATRCPHCAGAFDKPAGASADEEAVDVEDAVEEKVE